MTQLNLSPTKTKTELLLWQQQGKNLLLLLRLKPSKKGFSLHIPGYRCNQWYQVGKQYYASQQLALAAYGELLDMLWAALRFTQDLERDVLACPAVGVQLS